MVRITTELIDKVVAEARQSPRRRMNYNFHPELSDPVQRLLNALEPWTYIRPHKHTTKEESFVLLSGTVLAVVFNNDGTIRDHAILSRETGILGLEFEENCFHMLTSLETGSVVFEIKEGPFVPHTEGSSAPWAPLEGTPEARTFLSKVFDELKIKLD
ncbi:MAG TPA: WbuC family cupin fold metalloprotein [Bacteroidales bacterium]|nr:WbuC family cupin fold metalloprotein [Bacteroidales bacterium]